MTWSPETIAAVLVALGVGPLLHQLITGVGRWLSGFQSREKARQQYFIDQRNSAEERAEEAIRERRLAEADSDTWREYAMTLRFLMVQKGCDNIPDMPSTSGLTVSKSVPSAPSSQ